MDRFVPPTAEHALRNDYCDLLQAVAGYLRLGSQRLPSLLAKLRHADSAPADRPFGPLSQDEAELVVLLACNGPWHTLPEAGVHGCPRFRSRRPRVQVWDPRCAQWRPAMSVFHAATWGMCVSVGIRNVFGWRESLDAATVGGASDRFMLEDRSLGRLVTSSRPFTCSYEELVWLRHLGHLDSSSWVARVSASNTAFAPSAVGVPPSAGWMLIDNAIAGYSPLVAFIQPASLQPSHQAGSIAPTTHAQPMTAAVATPPIMPNTQQGGAAAAGIAAATAGFRALESIGNRMSGWAQPTSAAAASPPMPPIAPAAAGTPQLAAQANAGSAQPAQGEQNLGRDIARGGAELAGIVVVEAISGILS